MQDEKFCCPYPWADGTLDGCCGCGDLPECDIYSYLYARKFYKDGETLFPIEQFFVPIESEPESDSDNDFKEFEEIIKDIELPF